MAKPLKFHQTLNLPPRSVKNHGKYRRPSAAAHSHSVGEPGDSAGGSDPGGATWTTLNFTNRTFIAWDLALSEPTPPAVPYAGIRTGEIIGQRLWWLIEGHLCSLAHRRLWVPGETIYGDTNKIVQRDWMLAWTIWGGTYAFANKDALAPEIAEHQDNVEKLARQIANGVIWFAAPWHPYTETRTLVAGTIKMWGEVVEHELGYRAEFAKLNSIDELLGPGDIEALRAKYFSLSSTDRTNP